MGDFKEPRAVFVLGCHSNWASDETYRVRAHRWATKEHPEICWLKTPAPPYIQRLRLALYPAPTLPQYLRGYLVPHNHRTVDNRGTTLFFLSFLRVSGVDFYVCHLLLFVPLFFSFFLFLDISFSCFDVRKHCH